MNAAELIAAYGKNAVSVVARRAAAGLYVEIENGHQCRVCGKAIVKRSMWKRDASTNFARASHGQMHVRKGDVVETYGGVDGYLPTPTEAEVQAEVARRAEIAEGAKPLVALRAALRPLVTRKREIEATRDGFETPLRLAIRRFGCTVLGDRNLPETVETIHRLHTEACAVQAEIDALQATYPQAVLNQLVLGDFV